MHKIIENKYNMRQILETTINLMEEAEDADFGKLSGAMKHHFVIRRLQEELGSLFDSYEEEINTTMEAVIFISKLGRILHVNEIVKKNFKCFSFL